MLKRFRALKALLYSINNPRVTVEVFNRIVTIEVQMQTWCGSWATVSTQEGCLQPSPYVIGKSEVDQNRVQRILLGHLRHIVCG